MSSTSSDGSRATTLGGYARRLSMIARPNISIDIDNHYHSKVYTTSSKVCGHVTISPQADVRFDTIQILLLGTSKTRVDNINIPRATCHTFLKLIMPIPESTYQVPRIFEGGRTYKMPFTFVIPSYLTLNACNHAVSNDSVREHHVRLPPTMGSWIRDDFAPQMARVQYVIRARVYRQEEIDGFPMRIMEAAQEINVLPAVAEDAPLNITKHDNMYTMSKSKNLRKAILSPKAGKVTVSATQPSAAMLSPDGQTITPVIVPIKIDFEPTSGDSQPPKVTGISSKVTAVTFFSCSGTSYFPNLEDWTRRAFPCDGQGSYSSTTSVATTPVGPISWRTRLTTQRRRDSGYCSDADARSDISEDHHSTATAASSAGRGRSPNPNPRAATTPTAVYHTTTLHVPVQLPARKKVFVPSFHSCITSRVYVLWVTLSLAASPGGSSCALTLGVPLQVGVSAADGAGSGSDLPTFEAALQEDAEADEYFRPRSLLGAPAVGEAGGTLPGYADLMGGAQTGRGRSAVAAH
ncbi:hypothetical protein F4779DRAFT_642266 [Xylariaceae sp. FL0662B]|nr:hypothetical protein F4779DRAFT_642266 [Xylariaceae sp. FL0662B]